MEFIDCGGISAETWGERIGWKGAGNLWGQVKDTLACLSATKSNNVRG